MKKSINLRSEQSKTILLLRQQVIDAQSNYNGYVKGLLIENDALDGHWDVSPDASTITRTE